MDREFAEQIYELYKLDWLASHSYTVTDLIRQLVDIAKDSTIETLASSNTSKLIGELNFDGQMWASFDEFLQCEYEDNVYIESLLVKFGNPPMIRRYKDEFEMTHQGKMYAVEITFTETVTHHVIAYTEDDAIVKAEQRIPEHTEPLCSVPWEVNVYECL